MRREHVRSSLAPAGLAVQTSTFNALDSSDVGNATTNLSAKTAYGYYGRLVTLVAFTIAHPYNPIIVPRRLAFSSSPSRDGPVETKVVRGALTVATTALLQASSPRQVWGYGNGHLTIGKDARIVMEGRGRVRVKSSRSRPERWPEDDWTLASYVVGVGAAVSLAPQPDAVEPAAQIQKHR